MSEKKQLYVINLAIPDELTRYLIGYNPEKNLKDKDIFMKGIQTVHSNFGYPYLALIPDVSENLLIKEPRIWMSTLTGNMNISDIILEGKDKVSDCSGKLGYIPLEQAIRQLIELGIKVDTTGLIVMNEYGDKNPLKPIDSKPITAIVEFSKTELIPEVMKNLAKDYDIINLLYGYKHLTKIEQNFN